MDEQAVIDNSIGGDDRWVYIDDAEHYGYNICYDKKTITYELDEGRYVLKFWIEQTYIDPIERESDKRDRIKADKEFGKGDGSKWNSYNSRKVYLAICCKEELFSIKTEVSYDTKGTVIETLNYRSRYERIVPDSFMDIILWGIRNSQEAKILMM
jgi:hypothetical protein